MGVGEIRAYLSHLAMDKDVAASTQNVALSALLFLYRRVLRVELPNIENIERAGVWAAGLNAGQNVFVNVVFLLCKLGGAWMRSDRNKFVGCTFKNNGPGAGLTFDSSNLNVVSGCDFFDFQTPKKQTYGIQSLATSTQQVITGCQIRASDHLNGSMSLVGSNEFGYNNES